MAIRRVAAAPVIGAAMFLFACGGRDGTSTGAPPPSNNWDSMVWDQGNWG